MRASVDWLHPNASSLCSYHPLSLVMVLLAMSAVACADESAELLGGRAGHPGTGAVIVNQEGSRWVHRDGETRLSLNFGANGQFEAERLVMDGGDQGGVTWQVDVGTYVVQRSKLLLRTKGSSCGGESNTEISFGITASSLLVQTSTGALVFNQEPLPNSSLKRKERELCLASGWLGPKPESEPMPPPQQAEVIPVGHPPSTDLPEGHFATCGREIQNPVTGMGEYWEWQQGAIDLDGRGTYWLDGEPGGYEGDKRTGALVFKSGPLLSAIESSFNEPLAQIYLGDIGAVCERTGPHSH
jgi:hypothetical protein